VKPSVAMLAYACDPLGNGEHWLGWGWARTAARICDLTLIARSAARTSLTPLCDQAGIRLRFVDLPAPVRLASNSLGAAGTWWRKIAWAKRAASEVAQIRDQIHCVHQTTFHTFRVPFYAASLGLPSVWGPMGGGESTPPGFSSFLGHSATSEKRRQAINRLWLRWPPVQRALRDTGKIFVSNRTTLGFLPEFARSKSVIVPPNTVRDDEAAPGGGNRPVNHDGLRLVYAGNCVATRCMPLVLDAMRNTDRIHLSIAGEGPALPDWKTRAAPLGSRVTFLGKISRPELAALYAKSNALVFPALRDSGGSALLEAMSLGLPVICLDWGGPGEVIDDSCGIKIPVDTPHQVISDLHNAFLKLRDDEALRVSLARYGAKRAGENFTWEWKRQLLQRVYYELTGR
jgi:glycosyltransferase involved in cell wall biosynthesis